MEGESHLSVAYTICTHKERTGTEGKKKNFGRSPYMPRERVSQGKKEWEIVAGNSTGRRTRQKGLRTAGGGENFAGAGGWVKRFKGKGGAEKNIGHGRAQLKGRWEKLGVVNGGRNEDK